MVYVVTNSRLYATEKLLATYGLRLPFRNVEFITDPADLPPPMPATRKPQRQHYFADPSAPAVLVIWQRGRLTKMGRALRADALNRLAGGNYREPTKQDLETGNA